MGFEIDYNNGATCYRATAVLLPPVFGNSVLSQCLQVNERMNSEIKCDILISFSIETVLNNSL
jgi:hypothetical protein